MSDRAHVERQIWLVLSVSDWMRGIPALEGQAHQLSEVAQTIRSLLLRAERAEAAMVSSRPSKSEELLK